MSDVNINTGCTRHAPRECFKRRTHAAWSGQSSSRCCLLALIPGKAAHLDLILGQEPVPGAMSPVHPHIVQQRLSYVQRDWPADGMHCTRLSLPAGQWVLLQVLLASGCCCRYCWQAGTTAGTLSMRVLLQVLVAVASLQAATMHGCRQSAASTAACLEYLKGWWSLHDAALLAWRQTPLLPVLLKRLVLQLVCRHEAHALAGQPCMQPRCVGSVCRACRRSRSRCDSQTGGVQTASRYNPQQKIHLSVLSYN